MYTIKRSEVFQLIDSFERNLPNMGTVPTTFWCRFYKRTNGEERRMSAMLGSKVTKGIKGGPVAYNPSDHNLIWVAEWKREKGRFAGIQRRSIPIEGLIEIKHGKKVYKVID